MLFLKKLIGEAIGRAAADPRIRQAAKDVYEDKIKPTAQSAWDKARPELEDTWKKTQPKMEEAWAKAKPKVAAATKKAASEAGRLADQIKQEVKDRSAAVSKSKKDP